jgi:hypothetical protein
VEPPPISHGRPKATAMALDSTASRVVAAWVVGVLVLCRSVWDSGATLHPFQQRRIHELDSQTPEDFAFGREDWVPGRQIRRGDDRSGKKYTQYRCHDIVKFCGIARRTRGKKNALFGKPIECSAARTNVVVTVMSTITVV